MLQKGFLNAAEEMSFERGHADSAGGSLVADQNIAAIRALLQSHFRNNGNSQTCSDHSHDAAELAAFEYHLGQDAGPLADFNGGFAEAVIVTEQQEGLFAQLLQLQAPPLGQMVV